MNSPDPETPLDSTEARMNFLMELLRGLSSDSDPIGSINRYSTGIRRLFGNEAMISVSLRGVPEGYYRVMRFLHQQDLQFEGQEEILYAGRDAPSHTNGVLADLMEGGRPVVCRGLTIAWDPVLGRQLAPYRALLGFPVFDQGLVLNWVFFLHTSVDAYDDRDVETHILQANLMGGITSSKRANLELRQAGAWINREVDEIANLQRGLLPESLPESADYELAAYYATYDRAGGDFYTVLELEDTDGPALGLFIADASGHGPSAAVVIAMVYALLRTCPAPCTRPGKVLEYLNDFLSTSNINHSFVTAFYGVLHPDRRQFVYACAGHPMPVWSPHPGEVRRLARARNVPLGITARSIHEEEAITLGPGHRLLLYTDGITEARSFSGQFFGEDRLGQALAAASGASKDVMAAVQADFAAHTAGVKPVDDQSMLLLRLR